MENNGREEKKGREPAVVKIRAGDTGGLVGFLVLGGAMAVVAIVTHAMKAARARAAVKERADGEPKRVVESNEEKEEEDVAPPRPQPQSPVAAVASSPLPLLPAPEQRLALPPPPPPQDLPPETLSSETPQRREENTIHATPTIEVTTDEAHRTLPQEEERMDVDVEPQPNHDYDPSQAQHEELEESWGNDQEDGQQEEEEQRPEDESEPNTESSADELSSNESNTDRWPAEASESSTTSLEELGMKLQHDPKPYEGNVRMKTLKEDGWEGDGSMTTIKASDRRAIHADNLKGLVGFVSTLVAVVAVIVVMHTQQERIAENLQRLYQWMFRQDSFQQKI